MVRGTCRCNLWAWMQMAFNLHEPKGISEVEAKLTQKWDNLETEWLGRRIGGGRMQEESQTKLHENCNLQLYTWAVQLRLKAVNLESGDSFQIQSQHFRINSFRSIKTLIWGAICANSKFSTLICENYIQTQWIPMAMNLWFHTVYRVNW